MKAIFVLSFVHSITRDHYESRGDQREKSMQFLVAAWETRHICIIYQLDQATELQLGIYLKSTPA